MEKKEKEMGAFLPRKCPLWLIPSAVMDLKVVVSVKYERRMRRRLQ